MKIAIYGYGELGKGVEKAVSSNPDVTLTGIFSRRAETPYSTENGNTVYPAKDVNGFKNEMDVLILCAGSARDLPMLTPLLAKNYNVVDSFDTHGKMKEHYLAVNRAAESSGHTAIIGAGWDPGIFSAARAMAEAFLPDGKSYTFWGRGVSRGHTEAIKGISGVEDAVQYTVPNAELLDEVLNGGTPDAAPEALHRRECFVSAHGDLPRIGREIKNMPDYFSGYETSVSFVAPGELKREHNVGSHGGQVIRNGTTGSGTPQSLALTLKLGSNAEFTGSVMIAYASAIYRMNLRGITGCKTVLDIPPSELLPDGLREEMFRYL